MSEISTFFTASLITQLFHSAEELSTGFHKKWYLFKMSFWQFLWFEVVFTSFWIAAPIIVSSPSKEYLQAFFLVLMFANGVQHIIWWGIVKKYIPGLVTAFAHIGIFLIFYFKVFF